MNEIVQCPLPGIGSTPACNDSSHLVTENVHHGSSLSTLITKRNLSRGQNRDLLRELFSIFQLFQISSCTDFHSFQLFTQFVNGVILFVNGVILFL